ncbi:glycosyltransferase family 8 protein [Cloacibacillus sp. An23]|uniref:glycosyltransferase family 8 protein n=1 Tax=Cloacibacillus sp. An23 TaxID=1965591 RepID=UPI000B3AC160|nr:glycosyltransferase family 8 protein [Cloacibacillus sp. An23]OUO95224.1 hypothetical protein B5F39_01455 [Cloacibacillus sp. An23]
MIQVALSVYDPKGTYARHAGVVIASVLRNTEAPVCFHILHDDTLTDENRSRLEESAAEHQSKTPGEPRGTVDFIDVSDAMGKFPESDFDKICGRFSRGTLYRLMLPEIIHDSVDKVIYLDCDIVVALDIADLWKIVSSDTERTLGGVQEDRSPNPPASAVPISEIKTDAMGLSRERYINAGVLYMNLERLRSERTAKTALFQRAVAYIDRFAPPLLDQDFLNAEYLGDILYLDPRYNTDPKDEIFESVFEMERIWHFGGHLKPWNALTGTNADMLYWKYLSLTPWRDELWDSLFAAMSNEKYYHRHSKGCVKRLKSQVWDNMKDILKLRR